MAATPSQVQCGGAINQARAVQGETGKSATQTLKGMALDVLSRSVLNEEHIIEQESITIYTKM